jgi:hypothetical protein
LDTFKAILVGVLSLIVAVALAFGLTIWLLSIEYQSDPVLLIATSFVGFWMLFCSFYFKRGKIRQGAFALLGFSFLGLIVMGA